MPVADSRLGSIINKKINILKLIIKYYINLLLLL